MKSQPKGKGHQPIHLHIQENTPVYVHLIPDKDSQPDNEAVKSKSFGQFSNPASPRKEPWIPPPAKTSKKEKEKTISLPVTKRRTQPLSTAAEEGSLLFRFQTMSAPELNNVGKETTHDVGTLTNLSAGTAIPSVLQQEEGMALDITEQNQERPISMTWKEHEDEIAKLREELDTVEKRCQLLFSSLHFVHSQNELKSSLESKQDTAVQQAKDLKKMTSKVELQARESAATLNALMDLVESLRKEARNSQEWKSKITYLYKEKEELLNKLLTAFETNNVVLRKMIESHQETYESLSSKEYLPKSDALQDTIQKLHTSLAERDQHISSLERDLNAYKDQVSSFESTKVYLEKIRSQMQRELHNKEAQLERLKSHMQKLQSNFPEENKEIQKLNDLLEQTHDKARAEKEALKKAVRVQRQRVEQNEEVITQLRKSLEKNKQLVTLLVAERDQWKATVTEEMNKEIKAKAQQSTIESKMQNLKEMLKTVETSHQEKLKELTATLESRSSQLKNLTVENEKLKSLLEQEKQSVGSGNRQSPIFPSQEQQTTTTLVNLPSEQGSVHSMLEDLKTQLLETKEVNLVLKEQLHEAAIQISDLTLKLEQKGEQIPKGNTETKTDKVNLQAEASEGSLQMHTNGNKDESLCCLKLRLQEKQEELHRLENILKQLQEDSQKQTAELKKQFQKQEQYWQDKISRLDREMEEKKFEVSKVLKEKDEMEYKLRRKLEDVEDSLVQSQSSNQSLQKYVQFLKSSYASVFGEPLKWSKETLE